MLLLHSGTEAELSEAESIRGLYLLETEHLARSGFVPFCLLRAIVSLNSPELALVVPEAET